MSEPNLIPSFVNRKSFIELNGRAPKVWSIKEQVRSLSVPSITLNRPGSRCRALPRKRTTVALSYKGVLQIGPQS